MHCALISSISSSFFRDVWNEEIETLKKSGDEAAATKRSEKFFHRFIFYLQLPIGKSDVNRLKLYAVVHEIN